VVHEPEIAEQVAIGIALGALGALVHLSLARVRARLSFDRRHRLAWAMIATEFVLVGSALVIAAAVAPLAVLAYVVGVLGTRAVILAETEAQA
jgi:hypothetical protein